MRMLWRTIEGMLSDESTFCDDGDAVELSGQIKAQG
jgi:hypothetical protein